MPAPLPSDQMESDIAALRETLAAAREPSALPDQPEAAAEAALHGLVVRARLTQ